MNAILITGASRRIGKEIALLLGANDYPIAVHYNSSEKEAELVAQEINTGGGSAVTIQADLRDGSQVKKLIKNAENKLGKPVSGLVNNAAAFVEDTVQTFSETTFKANFETNLLAPLILSQSFSKALPKGQNGAIVNIIDQRVLGTSKGFVTYTASKHSLYALTRILATELAPTIRVNGIGPGPTFQNDYQNEADFKKEIQALPLRRGPTPQEIAFAVKFLLETPSITGQMIALDGGQHLS